MKINSNKLRIFVTFLAIVVSGCSEATGSKLIGQPAPSIRITLLDDTNVVPLSQFTNSHKPVVLAFWASTCNYSPGRLETVDKLAKKLKPKGIQFVAISIDKAKDVDQLRSVIKHRKLDQFVQAFSGNDIYDEAYIAFQGDELPYFVVIDAQGTVVATGDKASVVEDYFEE